MRPLGFRSGLPATLAVFTLGTASAADLGKEASTRLAWIRAQHIQAASFAALAKPGRNAQLAAAVKRLGGRVRYRFDAVDYLTAVLPAQEIMSFVGETSLESMSLDEPSDGYVYYGGWYSLDGEQREAPRPAAPVETETDWPPRLTARPLERPYPILKDLDALELRAAHPTFDGRGVVIAQVEWFADFLLPELQVALDIEGHRIPKFADVLNVPQWVPSLEQDAERVGPEWVRLDSAMTPRAGAVTYKGKQYRLGSSGACRLGELVVPSTTVNGSWKDTYRELVKVYGSEKRRTAEADEAVVLTIAWSEREGTLRIDTNRNFDFTDDAAVAPYARAQGFGMLGRDDPQTPQRESFAYAVQKDGDFVSVNMGIGGHATMVAGGAAASRGDAGRIEGVAPGAQILAIREGNRITSYAHALIVAFSDPRSDVVLIEGQYPITALHDIKDGGSTLALLESRLVERYRKPAFVTAFNRPGLSSIEDFSIPHNVMSVGAYQSAASVYANYGLRTGHVDDLHWVGSEGPAGNGALKPDFLSPANPMTLYTSFSSLSKSLYAGVFELPPGYQIGEGTSTATPVASGAAALLVSGAKQTGRMHDADSIHRAMRASARFLPHFAAFRQGHGLVQVEAAWRALQEVDGREALAVTVDAPVQTVLGDRLATPSRGPGFFEREGWNAGDRALRKIKLTRTSGPKRSLTCELQWQGNAAQTFVSPERIELELRRPASLEVAVNPKTVGVHSAIALLSCDSMPGHIAVPFTVVAPYTFDEANGYVQEVATTVDRPGRGNLFFRIPAGTEALTVKMAHSQEGLGAMVIGPDNRGGERVLRIDPASNSVATNIALPQPGVWEVSLVNWGDVWKFDWTVRNEPFLPATPVRVEVSVGGVSIDAAAAPGTLELHNRLAAFDGAARGSLGSARIATGTLKGGEQKVFEMNVEEGTEFLFAEVTASAAAGTDIDLYLYDCTAGRCLPARYGDGYGSRERVWVDRPRAGAWKVIMNSHGRGAPAYQYRDVVSHPGLGAWTLADADRTRSVAARWAVTGNVWRAGGPAPDHRQRVGIVRVFDARRTERHKPVDPPANIFNVQEFALDQVPLGLQVISLDP